MTKGQEFWQELEMESKATRKCLEGIPDALFSWKPHPKSMTMGNLAFIVSDIPRWITTMIKQSEIDFVKFRHDEPKNSADLVKFFDEHSKSAKAALEKVTDEQLEEMFYLKANGVEVARATKKVNIISSINHLVHHRGQLTVYRRLNDLPVPAIYGPSVDERGF